MCYSTEIRYLVVNPALKLSFDLKCDTIVDLGFI